VQREADVVDGVDGRHLPLDQEPLLDRELLDEVTDLQKRVALGHG